MHPRSAEFPGFTSEQIEAGLTTPVCDGVPRYPHAAEYADIEAAWTEDDTRQAVREHLDDLAFAGDALGIAAAEYVAAQARVEPLWLAIIGAIGVFITAFGLCAWAAMAQEQGDRSWHLLTKSEAGTVSLLKDMTKHQCEFALHRARGEPATDEEIAAAQRRSEIEQAREKGKRAAWLAIHPECDGDIHSPLNPSCGGIPFLGSATTRMVRPSDIASAECFQ